MNAATPKSLSALSLLDTRVSELLAQDDSVLAILVEHGFTPLKNPLARMALAPTVTLEQAVRLRGLDAVQEARLLSDLEDALCP